MTFSGVGFVPPEKLVKAEFCVWSGSHFLPLSIPVCCLTSLITDTQNWVGFDFSAARKTLIFLIGRR